MKTRCCVAELIGGPADGLRIRLTGGAERELLLAYPRCSAAAVGRSARRQAQYRLREQLEPHQTGGVDPYPCRYEFVGICLRGSTEVLWQLAASFLPRLALPLPAGPLPAGRRARFAPLSLSQRLRAWLLTPVDYPLRVSAP